MRIVITGGTGLVGSKLIPNLQGRNHGVVVVTRDPEAARARLPHGTATFALDAPLREALHGSGAVIHLAGEPIVQGRWTPAKKERIRASRVDATRRLVTEIAAVPKAERPGVLVAASAIGWYGDAGEQEMDETAPPGADFLAGVCRDWEAAALAARDLGVRVAVLRFGIVLAREGGALRELDRVFRMFVGAPLGPGANWMSWIHHEDLTAMIGFALEREDIRGPVNAVSPEPVRQVQLCRALARRLRRPCWPGVPRPIVRLLFGEKADVLLGSQRVLPRVAQSHAFAYRHPTIAGALADLYP